MMYNTRGFVNALVSAFLLLIESVSSAPQYFLDSCVCPLPFNENLMYLAPSRGQNMLEIRGNYPMGFYPVNYLGSNPWFAPDYSLDMSLVPPVREESEFRPIGPEHESDGNELQRGRSDIDPFDDNEGLGYFYPKPKVAFNLPDFTPLSDGEEVPQDATIATTTTEEEITDKVTTVSVPETSSVKV